MINTRSRAIVYTTAIILLPEIVLANLIIPTLSVSLPIMWILLIGVIAVESLVLAKRWPEVNLKKLIKTVAITNLISTAIGVPVAYYLHLNGITMPISLMLTDVEKKIVESLPEFLIYPLYLFVNAPVVIALDDLQETYLKFLYSLPVMYYISYWLE